MYFSIESRYFSSNIIIVAHSIWEYILAYIQSLLLNNGGKNSCSLTTCSAFLKRPQKFAPFSFYGITNFFEFSIFIEKNSYNLLKKNPNLIYIELYSKKLISRVLLRFQFYAPHHTTLAIAEKWPLICFHISYRNSKISWRKMPILYFQSLFRGKKSAELVKKNLLLRILN